MNPPLSKCPEDINRKIPISKFLVKELTFHKKNQEEIKQQMGNSFQNNNLVICTESGRPYNHLSLAFALKKIVKVAGVNDITFNDIRRIHLSNF